MSAKARSLRERMSIDPDAPTPVAERRPRPRREPDPPTRDAAAPRDAPVPHETPTPREVPADRDEPPATALSPTPAPPARSRPTGRSAPRPRAGGTSTGRRPRRSAERVDWETAIDDPAISADGNGYRSFYVSDEVFARFRAAVYWTARRPDADGVPDNMSAGVEEYMESVAADLERRFNDRAVFPPTPDQIRSHRKRERS